MPAAVLIPLAPHHAYLVDLERLGERGTVADTDDAWLSLAQLVWRAAHAPLPQRSAVLIGAGLSDAGDGGRGATDNAAVRAASDVRATAADAAAAGVASAAGGDAAVHSLRALAAASPHDRARRVLAAVDATRLAVEGMERAGLFHVAYGLLAALDSLLRSLVAGFRSGAVEAHRARIARQLGELDVAATLYDSAYRAARRASETEVALRALLGAGVLANMRGNYPEARRRFARALGLARRHALPAYEAHAHQGLLHAALVAKDADTALRHGWAALGAGDSAPEQRIATLINLAEVCRLLGEQRAALGGYLRALELSDLPRLRLSAVGGAALSAAILEEQRLLDYLARDATRVISQSGQPFENAMTLVELAEAYAVVGDGPAAVRYARDARDLASEGGFHEVTYRADALLSPQAARLTIAATTAVPPHGAGAPALSVPAHRVVDRLERYAATAVAFAAASSGAHHQG